MTNISLKHGGGDICKPSCWWMLWFSRISVSELCVVGKPVIFIPSPNVAEDHQTKNARAIADKNAAVLIKEADLDSQFKIQFDTLMISSDKRLELSKNIKQLALVNATRDIADEVEKLLKQ